ncbi:MAG: tetratricopeptide repeat protein [Dysgonomonas sp.]
MKQIIVFIIILISSAYHAYAQETLFKKQNDELVSKKDTLSQKKLLKEWEGYSTNDPELYVAYFNYYINKSRNEAISITTAPPKNDKETLVLTDTANNAAGYLYCNIEFDPNILKRGLDYISKGIDKFPDRLDMRFGKICMLGETGEYESFTKEILKVIDRSAINNNKWQWTDNKLLDNGKYTLIESVQDYILQIYNTEDDNLLKYMKEISEGMLKYYPDEVYFLSDLSIVYMLTKEYDNALDVLLKAYKIAPEDKVVISNIAHAYKVKGDKKNAIKFYKLALKLVDGDWKTDIENEINELSK